jgi:hypothetical protein
MSVSISARGIVSAFNEQATPVAFVGYARMRPGGSWYVNSYTFNVKQPVVTIGTVHRSSTTRWDAYCGLGNDVRHYGYATGPHPAFGAVALLLLFGTCRG